MSEGHITTGRVAENRRVDIRVVEIGSPGEVNLRPELDFHSRRAVAEDPAVPAGHPVFFAGGLTESCGDRVLAR